MTTTSQTNGRQSLRHAGTRLHHRPRGAAGRRQDRLGAPLGAGHPACPSWGRSSSSTPSAALTSTLARRSAPASPFEFERVDFDPPFRADPIPRGHPRAAPRAPSLHHCRHDVGRARGRGRPSRMARRGTRQRSSSASSSKNYDPRKDWAGRMAHSQSAWRPSSEARTRCSRTIATRLAPVPIILNIQSAGKTRPVEQPKNGRKVTVPTNIGFQPIAPADIVHGSTSSRSCRRADGVPKWKLVRSQPKISC
jgi:hypothetical protein